MIRLEKICTGTLMQCTKYEMHNDFASTMFIGDTPCFSGSFGYIETASKPFEKNVYLLKVKDGGYVRLDNIKSLKDYFEVNHCLTKNGFKFGSIMLSTGASHKGSIFVDEKSLKTIAEQEVKKNYRDIKLLQKEFLSQK